LQSVGICNPVSPKHLSYCKLIVELNTTLTVRRPRLQRTTCY